MHRTQFTNSLKNPKPNNVLGNPSLLTYGLEISRKDFNIEVFGQTILRHVTVRRNFLSLECISKVQDQVPEI